MSGERWRLCGCDYARASTRGAAGGGGIPDFMARAWSTEEGLRGGRAERWGHTARPGASQHAWPWHHSACFRLQTRGKDKKYRNPTEIQIKSLPREFFVCDWQNLFCFFPPPKFFS